MKFLKFGRVKYFCEVIFELSNSILNESRMPVGAVPEPKRLRFGELRQRPFLLMFQDLLMQFFESLEAKVEIVVDCKSGVEDDSLINDIVFLLEVVCDGDNVSFAVVEDVV